MPICVVKLAGYFEENRRIGLFFLSLIRQSESNQSNQKSSIGAVAQHRRHQLVTLHTVAPHENLSLNRFSKNCFKRGLGLSVIIVLLFQQQHRFNRT